MQFILRSSNKTLSTVCMHVQSTQHVISGPKAPAVEKNTASQCETAPPCVAQPLILRPRGWRKLRRVCRERVGQAGRHVIQPGDPGLYDTLPEP